MLDNGVAYLARRTALNSTEHEAFSRFGGLKAYGFIQMLENIISGAGSNGYYMNYTTATQSQIAQQFQISADYVCDILKFLLRRNYYSLEMFKKFRIITNAEIQEKYFTAVKRRKDFSLIKDYVLSSIIPKFMQYEKFKQFFGKDANNSDKGNDQGQSKNNNNREREDIKYTGEEEPISHSPNNNDLLIERFKKNYPNKIVEDNFITPSYVNFDLLLQKMEESTFLRSANNFTYKNLCKEDIYNKIVKDFYKDLQTPRAIVLEKNKTDSSKYKREE